MRIPVIRVDGTHEAVRSTSLSSLLKSGEVVSYHCSEGWVEMRRKRNMGGYEGMDRRKTLAGAETARRDEG